MVPIQTLNEYFHSVDVFVRGNVNGRCTRQEVADLVLYLQLCMQEKDKRIEELESLLAKSKP